MEWHHAREAIVFATGLAFKLGIAPFFIVNERVLTIWGWTPTHISLLADREV